MERYLDFRHAKVVVDRYLAGQYDLRSSIWFMITVDHWLHQFTKGVHRERKVEEKIHYASAGEIRGF